MGEGKGREGKGREGGWLPLLEMFPCLSSSYLHLFAPLPSFCFLVYQLSRFLFFPFPPFWNLDFYQSEL
ncbi:hypothetical protein KC363_g1 [Hortaea werneckii]|nr:hypothetical protein KC363_g1 [Hortaea werneckii]